LALFLISVAAGDGGGAITELGEAGTKVRRSKVLSRDFPLQWINFGDEHCLTCWPEAFPCR